MNHTDLKVKAFVFASLIVAQLNIFSAQASTLSTNAAWGWMKGSNIINQSGTYGTLGVANPANTPGARLSPVSWTDGAGALWLFGGSGYDSSINTGYLNDLWKCDPATTNWTWIKGSLNRNQSGTYGTLGVANPANTPGARQNAVSWTDGAGALWLFGGYGYDSSINQGRLNDLWKFDPATATWTWIKGSLNRNQPGTYGTLGVADAANTPGARHNAVSWIDGTGALWLFGGQGYDTFGIQGYLNDLWKLDPATTNWAWIKGPDINSQPGTYGTLGVADAANTPGAREEMVSWTDGTGALWLFGGTGYDALGLAGFLNDLWKFNPATTNWTWMKGAHTNSQPGIYGTLGVPDPANTPGARDHAVSWTDSSGSLWLCSGYGFDSSINFGPLNDLWKYDHATGNWIWMKGTNTIFQNGVYGVQGVPNAGNTPGTRYGAVSWTGTDGALWLYGGIGYDALGDWGVLNDLWKFDIGGGISLGTHTLVFSATAGAANPAAQVTSMTNVGVTAFTYTNVITYSAGASGWLTVSPVAGTLQKNGATILTNQINIAGLDAGTYYATNRITADATNSPQTVVVTLTVFGHADPTMVANGGWTFWFSSGGYLPSGPYYLSVPEGVPVAADFDADGYADPTMVANGGWTFWFSSGGYLPSGPYFLSVPGGVPIAADFDGDGYADPTMVANGGWTFWFSSGGYLPSGPYFLSVPGGVPVAADFDGDGYADPTMVANGGWTFWFSSGGYLPSGPYMLSVPGGVPIAADFDADGFADPTMVANGGWTFWFSSGGYLPSGPYFLSVPGGVPMAADFDCQ